MQYYKMFSSTKFVKVWQCLLYRLNMFTHRENNKLPQKMSFYCVNIIIELLQTRSRTLLA